MSWTDALSTLAVTSDGFVLVSWWKPIVIAVPLVAWGWFVSAVLDKHAARFFLPRQAWGVAHLTAAALGLALALFMPLTGELAFWMGFLALVVVLAADVGTAIMVFNKDDRVPENQRITFDLKKILASKDDKGRKAAGKSELLIKSPDKSFVAVPPKETPEFELRTAAETLFIKGIDQRATQIEIAPAKEGVYGVAYIIDGVRTAGDTMPTANAVKIIDFWKAAAKLDVQDRRRRLADDITIERGSDKPIKARVISSGGAAGLKLQMVLNAEQQVKRKPEDLGMLEPQMAELKELTSSNQGIVLLAAPGMGGRTTTLYTIVKMHDAYTSNVQTIEIEPQDLLEGVKLNKWDPQAEGPEYSTLVRSILRRDPNVVGLAELPDAATAQEIVKVDSERTRVYVSMKADGLIQAVQAWTKLVGNAEQASKGLRGVVAGKVLRKLCTNCRVPYAPQPDMLKKLNLPADKVKQLFKKGGQVIIKKDPETCPVCQGTGFVGMEGVFEICRIGDAEREMIKSGNYNGLRAELRKRGLPTLQMAALRKAVDGTTSVEEVLRVTAEPQAAAPAAKPGAPAGQGAKPAATGAAPAKPAPAAKPAPPKA